MRVGATGFIAMGVVLLSGAESELMDRTRILWEPSPNFNQRIPSIEVDTIILHHTAGNDLSSTVKWFATPESQVSAHFTIDRDGTIVQHVNTWERAWHAGVSRDAFGRGGVNDFSVGIEMVNRGDGNDPWPKAQVESANRLCSALVRRYPIKQIASHEAIAVPRGRKNDPRNFPWQSFRRFNVTLWY